MPGENTSNVIETLVVALEANYGRMTTDVRTAVSEVKTELSKIEQHTAILKADTSGFLGPVGDAIKSLSALGDTLFGVQRLFDVAKNAWAQVSGLVQYNVMLDKSTMGWKAMLQSMEDAEAMMYELQKFAAQTPLNFPQVVQASRMLVAMGVPAVDILGVMKDIVNITSSVGATNEVLMRISINLGQIMSMGRLTGRELRDMAMAGVNTGLIYEEMAKNLGKTVAEVKAMEEKGIISADMFMAAFRSVANLPQFIQATAAQMNTLSGATSTIEDNLSILKANALDPLYERLRDVALMVADFTSKQEFMIWGSRVGAAIDVALTSLGDLAGGFADAFNGIFDIVRDVGEAIYEALSYLNPFAEHSPSLVKQVEKGTDEIIKAYEDVGETVPKAMDKVAESAKGVGTSLDSSKEAITAHKNVLNDLKEKLAAVKDEYDKFSSAVLKGSGEYQNKLDVIQTQIEKLELQRARLATGPAGPRRGLEGIDKQLEQLKLQKGLIETERQANFGPLQRQIDKLKKDTKEMTFEEIVAGLTRTKPKVKELTEEVSKTEKVSKAMSAAAAGAKKAMADVGSAAKDTKLDLTKAKDELEKLKNAFYETEGDIRNAIKPIGEFIDLWIRYPIQIVITSLERLRDGNYEGALDMLKRGFGDLGERLGLTLENLRDFGTTVWNRISTEWAKIDWSKKWSELLALSGNLAGKVGEWLDAQFAKIGWGDAWKSAKDTATGLASGLRLQFEGLGKLVQEWLKKEFGIVEWADVWPDFQKMAQSLSVKITRALGLVKPQTSSDYEPGASEEIWRSIGYDIGTSIGKLIAAGIDTALGLVEVGSGAATTLIKKIFGVEGDEWRAAGEREGRGAKAFAEGFVSAFFNVEIWGPLFSEHWGTLLGILFLTPPIIPGLGGLAATMRAILFFPFKNMWIGISESMVLALGANGFGGLIANIIKTGSLTPVVEALRVFFYGVGKSVGTAAKEAIPAGTAGKPIPELIKPGAVHQMPPVPPTGGAPVVRGGPEAILPPTRTYIGTTVPPPAMKTGMPAVLPKPEPIIPKSMLPSVKSTLKAGGVTMALYGLLGMAGGESPADILHDLFVAPVQRIRRDIDRQLEIGKLTPKQREVFEREQKTRTKAITDFTSFEAIERQTEAAKDQALELAKATTEVAVDVAKSNADAIEATSDTLNQFKDKTKATLSDVERDIRGFGDTSNEVMGDSGTVPGALDGLAEKTETTTQRISDAYSRMLDGMRGDTKTFVGALGLLTTVIGSLFPATAAPTGTTWRGRAMEGRAGGGDIVPGRSYMVGERGPEPFVSKTPGIVFPNYFMGLLSGAMQRPTLYLGKIAENIIANSPDDGERLGVDFAGALLRTWENSASSAARTPLEAS